MDAKDSEIDAYTKRHSSSESPLLRELTEAAGRELEHIEMLCGPVVGRFLQMLIRISGVRRVLEIGTFAGYSALTMAEALPEKGRVVTCEINERYARLARTYFKKSEHGYKIDLRMGEALHTIESLENPFDFVFLDADKVNYPAYYKFVLPLLEPGGIIVADNVLWGGAVLDPPDEKSQAIDRFNRMAAEDNRVEQVMLTVRDGLSLIRKR